ncbi:hypothetical protein NDU88_002479 [Pleurodeles waltl]|uniref:Uncharacterized protein n=1 Tax=Pleurodeles waltl TaxID=8319 RepID=A0AAV7WQT0_PLEWA|nr:hypothetical protein NDU88_002479 [Pleurodeles waltl]
MDPRVQEAMALLQQAGRLDLVETLAPGHPVRVPRPEWLRWLRRAPRRAQPTELSELVAGISQVRAVKLVCEEAGRELTGDFVRRICGDGSKGSRGYGAALTSRPFGFGGDVGARPPGAPCLGRSGCGGCGVLPAAPSQRSSGKSSEGEGVPRGGFGYLAGRSGRAKRGGTARGSPRASPGEGRSRGLRAGGKVARRSPVMRQYGPRHGARIRIGVEVPRGSGAGCVKGAGGSAEKDRAAHSVLRDKGVGAEVQVLRGSRAGALGAYKPPLAGGGRERIYRQQGQRSKGSQFHRNGPPCWFGAVARRRGCLEK